jgi:hypothetical protein
MARNEPIDGAGREAGVWYSPGLSIVRPARGANRAPLIGSGRAGDLQCLVGLGRDGQSLDI